MASLRHKPLIWRWEVNILRCRGSTSEGEQPPARTKSSFSYKEKIMTDKMVLRTQQWLNQTYGGDSRFNKVAEDGQTGWSTIYGLTRALQIELGIQNTADNFGPSTRGNAAIPPLPTFVPSSREHSGVRDTLPEVTKSPSISTAAPARQSRISKPIWALAAIPALTWTSWVPCYP